MERNEDWLINDVLRGMDLPPLPPDRKVVLTYVPQLLSDHHRGEY